MIKTMLITLAVGLLMCMLPFRDVLAEEYTMTTYYPAPDGSYQHLKAESLTAPGIITGGGEEKADLDVEKMKGAMPLYDATAVPFQCTGWGQASCQWVRGGSLSCPAESSRQLTGAFMDNGIGKIIGHGIYIVKWYLCVSEGPQKERSQQ